MICQFVGNTEARESGPRGMMCDQQKEFDPSLDQPIMKVRIYWWSKILRGLITSQGLGAGPNEC